MQINNISKVYEDIDNEVEEKSVDYSFEKLDDLKRNSGMIEIEYNNDMYVISSVYKRCYNTSDP